MAQEASSSKSSPSSKMISLTTADNVVFEIDGTIAKQMKVVQAFIEEDDGVSTIPLPNVFSKDLSLTIEFCKKDIAGEITKDFEASFVKDLDNEELKVLFLAANYLNVNRLFEFLSLTIAKRLENKSVEYAREYFGVENDFTPEEEARVREERAWTFQGLDEDEV
ncbi:SKP1-like protein 14 [Vicia villosa]|uniref:SKP1-like protein 14 n=1 Tax=Vicia villosa TaxID=3911 RepID=UPI00273B3B7D|nr:SKP1-like protein 14 [Vicia villosa]